jgi:hypothetical protein
MMFCMDCGKEVEYCRCALSESERGFWLPEAPTNEATEKNQSVGTAK